MILDDLDHLVFLLRYSLLIGRPTEASSHLSTDFLSIQNIISPFPLPSRPWGSWVLRASWGQEESSFRSHRGRRRGWRTWTHLPAPRAPCQRGRILIEGFEPDSRIDAVVAGPYAYGVDASHLPHVVDMCWDKSNHRLWIVCLLTYHIGYRWNVWTGYEVGEEVDHHQALLGRLKHQR